MITTYDTGKTNIILVGFKQKYEWMTYLHKPKFCHIDKKAIRTLEGPIC